MEKIRLRNGLTVIYQEKDTDSLAIEVLVKVGSNQETPEQRGISHFIEHMLFEGTKKRPTSQAIANEIERLGGEINAYTSNERTCFYIKVLRKYFDLALDVLADLLQHPLLREEDLTREKKVIGKEIDLVNDEPRFYQWILFEKNLYQKHPVRFPTYGTKETISQLKRDDLLSYYRKYYGPGNMVVSLAGKVKDWQKKIEEKFIFAPAREIKGITFKEPPARKNKIKKEKRKIANTYLVLGYKTVPRKHPDSYVLEVINGILGRGQSGWLFQEIRGKRGLAYEVGTQHLSEKDYGYFAVYLSTERKKVRLVKKIILEQFRKLKNISRLDLAEAKNYVEGDYLLEIEDNQKLADNLVFWEQVKDVCLMKDFVKKIKKVKTKDVKRVVNKYFKNYCLVLIEGK